jgi:UDP-glucuronate 4-epimerase
LKEARIARLAHSRFNFRKVDICDRNGLNNVFADAQARFVVNLAAQPGVRYSLTNPYVYVDVNLVGFHNVLEACRQSEVTHFVYASSSSVYGANRALPSSTSHRTDHPISLYAATKKANELMAHAYGHLFRLPATGLRLFTVYGPWGRPDMALFSFSKAILNGETVSLYNSGNMARDFTYVDDIVEAIVRVLPNPPAGDPHWDPHEPVTGSSAAPYRLYNVGNTSPVKLREVIALLETYLGTPARIEYLPMQPGDVQDTFSDVSDLIHDFGFRPSTSLASGLREFVSWYKDYYGQRAMQTLVPDGTVA